MTMREQVERYLAFRRHQGYKLLNEERMLHDWADHAMARGDEFASAAAMIDWASGATSPATMHDRLSAVRCFAVWLHAEDERHEIPPRGAVGRRIKRRSVPHLLTRAQINRLMEAALSLPPVGSITPHTFRYMIGLMATTGLRRSEVCALRLTDITPDGLVIRQTKFRKSRLVSLHPSTRDALGSYLAIRTRTGGPDDHLFVLSTGGPPAPATVTDTFIRLARRTGLRGGPGEPGPRPHDLRHSFAVRSLETATATDRGSVNRHMLALSTYLGHARVSDTYWYLEATPAVLRQIAQATESLHAGRPSQ